MPDKLKRISYHMGPEQGELEITEVTVKFKNGDVVKVKGSKIAILGIGQASGLSCINHDSEQFIRYDYSDTQVNLGVIIPTPTIYNALENLRIPSVSPASRRSMTWLERYKKKDTVKRRTKLVRSRV